MSAPHSLISDAPCEKCGTPRGTTPTESVDGRGPGWKCPSCNWWTWITQGEGSLFAFLRRCRIRVVRRDELLYLKGVARSVAKMQRKHVADGEWLSRLQVKNRRLREQIACDQAYIDALEQAITAEDLQRIRRETSELRHRRAAL